MGVDPVETAAVFVPTLFSLLAVSFYSIITVISWGSLLLLMAVMCSKAYTHVMVHVLSKLPTVPNSDPLHKLYDFDLIIKSDHLESFASESLESMNQILAKLKDLFLFVNFMDSLKFGFVMYLISYIGSICNLLTIVILGWISVFSIPRLYMDNHSLIDCMWEKLQCQMADLKNKLCGTGSNSDESSDVAVSSPSSVKDEVADSPAVSQEKT